MKIFRNYTKTFDIYEAHKWDHTYGETMESRRKICKPEHHKGYEKCFVCNHKFNDQEIPWLAFVKNHKNVFLCEICGKKV